MASCGHSARTNGLQARSTRSRNDAWILTGTTNDISTPRWAPIGSALAFMRLAIAVAITYSASGAYADEFDGHRVVRIDVRNEAELQLMRDLDADVWSHGEGIGLVDVRVTPGQRDALDAAGLSYETLIDDVGALMRAQAEGFEPRGAPPFGDYGDFATLVAHMNALVAARPDLAQIVSLGNTIEGRPIWMIHVHGPNAPPNRPAVFYNGCQHAREWVSPPVVLYLADYLVNNYDTDPAIPPLLERVSFYLAPIVNSDGYVFSWTNNRLWRKNRRPNAGGTFGVDLNRNWGNHWGNNNGSSGSPGSDTYRGTAAFSEPETAALRDFFLAHPEIRAYIDFHSYSQLTMWPWGWTSTPSPADAAYREDGRPMRDAILAPFGTVHLLGPVYTTIYPVSGGSIDWTYGDAGVYSYAWELRDSGQFGFLLPAVQILPTCIENLPAAIYLADRVTAPVRFRFIDPLPSAFAPGQATTLNVEILPGTQVVVPSSAQLFYRLSSFDPFTSAPMTHLGGSRYEAALPAATCGGRVDFYLSAAGTGGGTNTEPLGGPGAFHARPVRYRALPLIDDFDQEQGWSVSSAANMQGAWVRVAPIGTTNGIRQAQPNNDNVFGSGTHCYVTGQGVPGGGPGAADVDGGPTILTSPLVDLSGGEAWLSYYRWMYCSNDNDVMQVQLSNNGGASWTTIETVRTGPFWSYRRFRVSDFLAPTGQMKLRFSVQDNPDNSVTEAAVDDVMFEILTCSDTAGDFNGNGQVDAGDIGAFVRVLLGYTRASDQIARADFNGDGLADGEDVGPFVEALAGD
ncbi:MAG: dockerin type I domain-containing protein [Phycisphaerae bacterium]|nr:dockerin type I domain-containing protein [Phycisphaerae bacterium]